MITINDLQQGDILPGQTVVLTDGEGLGREVTWVVVSRSRTPIFEGLKGGELVLISMRSLRLVGEELDLDRLFSYLAEMRVSGVAIMGQISDSTVANASELGLPVLSLPEGTSLSELERNVTKYIVDHRQQLQQWNQDVFRQFMELAIEGKGLTSIADRLAQLTGRTAIIEDNAFRLRARAIPEIAETSVTAGKLKGASLNGASFSNNNTLTADSLNSSLREQAQTVREWLSTKDLKSADPPLHIFETSGGQLQLTSPIIVQSVISGYVSLIGRDFGTTHRMALTRAASACAIERSREIAVSAVEDRFQANVLDELLEGSFANGEAVLDRAKRLGYNLSLPYNVITFAFRQLDSRVRKKPLTIVLDGRQLELDLPINETMAREMQRLVEQEANRRQISTIHRVRDDRFVLLFSTGKEISNPVESKKLAKVFHDRLAAHFTDLSVSSGLGRFYENIEGITKGAQESEKAVTMGLRLFGPGQLTYFGDLGVYRLLLSIGGQKELREFYHEILGRLLEHDARNGGELLQTLDNFFKYHGSPSKMAEGMHLHRNTLLYRLRRIQEISGVDLEDAETRMALHLALRIGEVLGERR